jgi:nucleoid-associated protein YgaU
MFRSETNPSLVANVVQKREGDVNAVSHIPKDSSASVANPSRNANPTSGETFAYSVQSGDTIEGIALRHFGSKAKIPSVIEANPQLRDVNRIYPGDTVFLPAESAGRNEKGIR